VLDAAFRLRAEAAKNTNMKPEKIDGYYEKAAHLAALVAPYRHARLSAMKLAGDPNNPVLYVVRTFRTLGLAI
jgi:hypothetical protein